MNESGGDSLLITTRAALLDALDALSMYDSSVIVVGAQAIYLHTGGVQVALAEATKDCDLALDTRVLPSEPRLEEAMRAVGFQHRQGIDQPGSWLSPDGIPIDLIVPEALAGGGNHRSARIPPHANGAARRAVGLEAAVVDHVRIEIRALASDDGRVTTAKVAGTAALLVAKLHKLGERTAVPRRLVDKDAHDIYRLLVAEPADTFADRLRHWPGPSPNRRCDIWAPSSPRARMLRVP